LSQDVVAALPPKCGREHQGRTYLVVVHELAHLREPRHGEAFVALMDANMPDWRARREDSMTPACPRGVGVTRLISGTREGARMSGPPTHTPTAAVQSVPSLKAAQGGGHTR
jgi:hypothetical protein